MKVQLHYNGRISVDLIPETNIERTLLGEMADRAKKGQYVDVSAVPTERSAGIPEPVTSMTISVEV